MTFHYTSLKMHKPSTTDKGLQYGLRMLMSWLH